MDLQITFKKSFPSIDIVTAFQEVAKANLAKLENGGCGMFNLSVPIFVGACESIVQVYPNDEVHEVWVLIYDEDGEHEDMGIEEFPEHIQKTILLNYAKALEIKDSIVIL